MKTRFNLALSLCAVGAAITLAGELIGVASPELDDTSSEVFKALPKWVQLLIFWMLGAVCSHLAEWRIRDAVSKEQS